MRGLVRGLDAFLRSRSGIFPYADREDCLLQIQISRAPRLLVFPDLEIEADEPVLLLHLWNDHLPQLPPDGPDLIWASRARHLFLKSLAGVAEKIRSDASLATIRAVGGRTSLFAPDGRSGGARLLRRLGFTVIPCQHGTWGASGRIPGRSLRRLTDLGLQSQRPTRQMAVQRAAVGILDAGGGLPPAIRRGW